MDVVGNVVERSERPAYVRFERRPIEDKQASLKEGRYIAKDIDFALVTPPYSKDCMEYKVTTWLENLEKNVRTQRVPAQWRDYYIKSYEAWKNGQELPLNGTPIKGWGMISPAQQEMLVHIKILTVEDLAGINDEAQRRIGMGSLDLKNKATAWVSQNKDKGPLTQEIAALRNENIQLKANLEALTEQVRKMASQPPSLVSQTSEFLEKQISKGPDIEVTNVKLEHDVLVAKYTEKFGQAPHHRMKNETIAEKIK